MVTTDKSKEDNTQKDLLAFAKAVNDARMEQVLSMLHPDTQYTAVLAGYSVTGREKVGDVFRKGIELYDGESRLGLASLDGVPCLLWWEPVADGFVKRGLLTLGWEGGLVTDIADSHDEDDVARAEGETPTE